MQSGLLGGFDAHADLRRDYEGFRWSHASVMEAVSRELPGVTRLVQVGVRDYCEEESQRIDDSGGRIVTFFDADLQARLAVGEPWAALVEEMLAPLPRTVYLSFDIDGLDPALCPHTGTPVPGGLNFAQACFLLRARHAALCSETMLSLSRRVAARRGLVL